MEFSIEKLEYLKKCTHLPPANLIALQVLKRKNVSQQELDSIEYRFRFEQYEKQWYKTWKNLKWGEKENENLHTFANDALEQQINQEISQKKSR